jgi:hypothetical protein
MSFKVSLKVDGKDYQVLKCKYTLNQNVDKSGRPTSSIIGGEIEITLKSSDETVFFEWMCDPTMKKDGTITFYKRDEEAKMKELNFSDAYLINYVETYDWSGKEGPLHQHLKLAARKIDMGGDGHANEWVNL